MKVLSASEVAKKTSMSVSNIRRLARNKQFPEPFARTENRYGWLETDVDKWISECVRRYRSDNYK
jgi:predicted DNA-binding transcriptional regulator AlpA